MITARHRIGIRTAGYITAQPVLFLAIARVHSQPLPPSQVDS